MPKLPVQELEFKTRFEEPAVRSDHCHRASLSGRHCFPSDDGLGGHELGKHTFLLNSHQDSGPPCRLPAGPLRLALGRGAGHSLLLGLSLEASAPTGRVSRGGRAWLQSHRPVGRSALCSSPTKGGRVRRSVGCGLCGGLSPPPLPAPPAARVQAASRPLLSRPRFPTRGRGVVTASAS